MQRTWLSTATILIALLSVVLGLGALTLGTRPVMAQVTPPAPDPTSGVAAIGDGEVSLAPDVAFVNLGVQSDGPTARQAIDASSTAMAAVISAVKGLGVPD